MKIKSHTTDVEKDVIKFHYNFTDLKEFISHGSDIGDNGWILTRKEGNLLTYRGYGTIEHPVRHLQTISIVHNVLFDREFNLEAILNPKPAFDKISHKIIILDLGDI